jgi:hypothetical protein
MVSLARNVTVVVPAVTPGTTAPVIIIATILDPTRTSTVLLQVRDEAGNQTFCKRSVRRSQTMRSRSFTP